MFGFMSSKSEGALSQSVKINTTLVTLNIVNVFTHRSFLNLRLL